MIVVQGILIILGASLTIAYIYKILNQIPTIDEAYRSLIRYIISIWNSTDIIDENHPGYNINENLLLIDDEWIELGEKFKNYFMNVSLVNYNLNNGILKVGYAINGTRNEFANDDTVLRRAIIMDIHNYYLKNRHEILYHIYIQSLTKGALIFWIGCNETGRKQIEYYSNLNVDSMNHHSNPELTETVEGENYDYRL